MKAKLPWFRMYAEFVDDPKVQRLPGDLFKFWANCLGLACQNDGVLPSVRDVAWKMKIKEAKASANIATLYEAGLLDQESDSFSPHNWSVRQFKSDTSTERVHRFRNKNETLRATPLSASGSDSVSESELPKNSDSEKLPTIAAAGFEYPETAAAIRQYFPTTDDGFIVEIIHDSMRVYADLTTGKRAPPLSDLILSEAVHTAKFPRQTSAGPFRKDVPRCVQTWAEQAIKQGSIR